MLNTSCSDNGNTKFVGTFACDEDIAKFITNAIFSAPAEMWSWDGGQQAPFYLEQK